MVLSAKSAPRWTPKPRAIWSNGANEGESFPSSNASITSTLHLLRSAKFFS